MLYSIETTYITVWEHRDCVGVSKTFPTKRISRSYQHALLMKDSRRWSQSILKWPDEISSISFCGGIAPGISYSVGIRSA